jgi:hypothetical protein
MRNERFTLSETSAFDYLYENRSDPEIGQKINVALAKIENNNSEKLRNVFRAMKKLSYVSDIARKLSKFSKENGCKQLTGKVSHLFAICTRKPPSILCWTIWMGCLPFRSRNEKCPL